MCELIMQKTISLLINYLAQNMKNCTQINHFSSEIITEYYSFLAIILTGMSNKKCKLKASSIIYTIFLPHGDIG